MTYFPVSSRKLAGKPSVESLPESGRVDRVDPGRAVREVEPETRVVGVARDHLDDLAEPERDDGEVVAAEPQRREPDHHATAAVITAAISSTAQIEMWIPPSPGGTPTAPSEKFQPYCSQCGDANHAPA